MLMANIWIKGGLVNRAIEIVYDILYEDQGLSLLFIAVFVKFNTYEGSSIITSEGDKVVLIVLIKQIWKSKSEVICFRFQIPIYLA